MDLASFGLGVMVGALVFYMLSAILHAIYGRPF